MADTIRDRAAMLTLCANNLNEQITAQTIRDLIVSVLFLLESGNVRREEIFGPEETDDEDAGTHLSAWSVTTRDTTTGDVAVTLYDTPNADTLVEVHRGDKELVKLLRSTDGTSATGAWDLDGDELTVFAGYQPIDDPDNDVRERLLVTYNPTPA